MATPVQRPRGGQGGGGPLIVLGVILALVAAVLVYILTNGANAGGGGQSVAVVTASQSLTMGTVLATGPATTQTASIDAVFHVEHLPIGDVPTDAYIFTSQTDLEKVLSNLVVVAPFLPGDILRQNDTRLSPLGAGMPGSITTYNPAALPAGDVIFAITGIGAAMPVINGDHIDLLATECVTGAASSRGGCQMAQTTLQDLVVYEVKTSTIYVAVTPQNALILQLLIETAQLDIVVRKPGDDGLTSTQAVDLAWIIAHYSFNAP